MQAFGCKGEGEAMTPTTSTDKSQWLSGHLDNMRTMLRTIGRDLVAVADEEPRCGEEAEYDDPDSY